MEYLVDNLFFSPSLGLGEGVQTKLINIYTLLTVDNYKVYNIYTK